MSSILPNCHRVSPAEAFPQGEELHSPRFSTPSPFPGLPQAFPRVSLPDLEAVYMGEEPTQLVYMPDMCTACTYV